MGEAPSTTPETRAERAPGGKRPPGLSDELAAEIARLDPAQAEMFVEVLALTMRKRRIMLLGYLAVIVVMLVGQIPALLYWAAREPGELRGWAFLVPPAIAGVILVVAGRLSRTLKPR